MIGNAIFGATVVMIAVVFFLLQSCPYLIPYRHVLVGHYASILAMTGAAFFLNLVALLYWVGRLLFLKDTGRKLAHLEKQLRTNDPLSDELSRHLKE